ncbi:MAG: PleD family two-component system response regulator, partial [Candidatus Paceibacteria bacterium]
MSEEHNQNISKPAEQYLILVVDDDELTRNMYVERFEQEREFRIRTASDGLEALQIMTEEEVPDLVFTGIIMPRMNGFDLIESMQDRVKLANIPVMISSHMGR